MTGEIEHDDQSTVDDEMLAAGYACTCVAYPASDVTLLTHQMDNFEAGVPESFNVLVKEVRGLGLNMELLDAEEEE